MDYPIQWMSYAHRLDELSDEWDRAYIHGENRETLNKLSDKRDALLFALGLAVWHELSKQADPTKDE